jgi:hypothetical protein
MKGLARIELLDGTIRISIGMKRMASARKKSRSNGSSGRRTETERFVVCLDSRRYPASLEVGKLYPVVDDREAAAHGYVRVVDETGESYLYAAERFADVTLPKSVRVALLASR